MKRLINRNILAVIIMVFLVINSWNSLAFATPNDGSIENIEEDMLASAPVTINTSISKVIPETTPLLNKGVISGGQPTYKISVSYKFTSPATFSGAATFLVSNVISDGTETTGTVLAISSTACGLEPVYSTQERQYVYIYTMVYHIRNTKSFDIQCKIHGANNEEKTTTVLLTLPTAYENKFEITCYYIEKESQHSGSRNTIAPGISGKKYKKSFLNKVVIEGSGYTEDGEYIQYNTTTGKYVIVSYPQTATGTQPKVGQTIAVDNTIIPRSGNGHKGKVYITDVGFRQAEDAGSGINGFHIDVYVGLGVPSPEPSWNKKYKDVLYYGNDLY